jgi:cytochrome b pre-mRNA-processing protein 3
MLSFLFRSLTAEPATGTALFAGVTAEARRPHWYVEGRISDTIDGRFAVLATVAALVVVRLEQLGVQGDRIAVAFTERFIDVMESEHRELGLGDPSLGKTVRKLVGSLARRTELWSAAVAGRGDWTEAVRESLYRSAEDSGGLEAAAQLLGNLWNNLKNSSADSLAEGRLQ